MRAGFGRLDDVAEKFLQAANAAEHALGGFGKARLNHGLELREPAPDVGQAADRMLRLKQARAAPKIKNGAVENDVEFAPGFPRARAIPMRYLGIEEEKITRAAFMRRSRSSKAARCCRPSCIVLGVLGEDN